MDLRGIGGSVMQRGVGLAGPKTHIKRGKNGDQTCALPNPKRTNMISGTKLRKHPSTNHMRSPTIQTKRK